MTIRASPCRWSISRSRDKVLSETICSETKKLATEYCPETEKEYFTEKTLPGKCDKHSTARWKDGEEPGGTISF